MELLSRLNLAGNVSKRVRWWHKIMTRAYDLSVGEETASECCKKQEPVRCNFAPEVKNRLTVQALQFPLSDTD